MGPGALVACRERSQTIPSRVQRGSPGEVVPRRPPPIPQHRGIPSLPLLGHASVAAPSRAPQGRLGQKSKPSLHVEGPITIGRFGGRPKYQEELT